MANNKFWLPVTVLLLRVLASRGQVVSNADSTAVLQTTNKLFAVFKQPTQQQFDALAADRINCSLCADQDAQAGSRIELPYMVSRVRFFREYLQRLRGNTHVKRAYLMREVRMFHQNPETLVVLVATWLPGEYQGSEGAQLELDFTKKDHKYLFSGISTIP